jgi:hypothetical protein
MMNAAIAGLADTRENIRKFWGCWEEHNGDGCQDAQVFTTIFDNNTAARWVKAAMKLNNPTLFSIVHYGQQADSTAGTQTPIRVGRCILHLDIILPPPAENMINHIGEGSYNDADM